jgi:hypothetical protein
MSIRNSCISIIQIGQKKNFNQKNKHDLGKSCLKNQKIKIEKINSPEIVMS